MKRLVKESLNEKLNEPHLEALIGKTIESVDQDYPIMNIHFTDGTYLELTPFDNEWGAALQSRIKTKETVKPKRKTRGPQKDDIGKWDNQDPNWDKPKHGW
jgi:hypothetical protein